jgi:hypothetical protein
MEEQKEHIRNPLIKFFINSFGTSEKFFISIIITVFFGFIYSFGIYDKEVLLFVFGMLLPTLYIVGIYQLFRVNKSFDNEESATLKVFKNRYSNILFMFIDISITLTIGLLIYFGILDYLVFKLLVTILLPVLYQIMIKFFISLI